MGYNTKSLVSILFSISILIGCRAKNTESLGDESDGKVQYGLSVETEKGGSESSESAPTDLPIETEVAPQESRPPEKWWMEFPWEKTVIPLAFDEDGTPIPIEIHPRSYYRIRGKTKEHTREIHKQIALALGLRVDERRTAKFANFLSTRSSIETSMQGNQRPFDTRGTVHSLDVAGAYRAGIRNRQKYVDAGNYMAIHEPYLFLGYGQGGMISWLFLDNWDLLGDPRMLGDSVIGGLTYRRSLINKFKMLTSSRIKCYEYDEVGRVVTHSFNKKKYRVGRYAVDEEAVAACIDDGPKSKAEKSSPKKLENRCRMKNRKSYNWRPGLDQPDNTTPVPAITWWHLKRASGGRPCPSWNKDELVEHTKAKFYKRAAQFNFNPSGIVRRRDLGNEPEGVNQYELWMQIWDAAMVSLEEEPINWENLRFLGYEERQDFAPSKAKLEDIRRRERGLSLDPNERKKKGGNRK